MMNPEEQKQIEEALKFLVFAIHETGHNPKPVILHSIRAGLHLYNLDYDKDIVVAAILHDVIEDKTEKYKENFVRCRKAGKEALIVKAADFFDNADYYNLASTDELAKWLLEKLKYFIDSSKDELKDEALYNELVEKYKRIAKTL